MKQPKRIAVACIVSLILSFISNILPFFTEEKAIRQCMWMLIFLSLNEVLKEDGNP